MTRDRQRGWSTSSSPAETPETDTPTFRDAARGIRIQKALANAGVGSRRHCEELIESGMVAVNGHVIASLPAWVDPQRDIITVEGRRIARPEDFVYVMLFKPRGVVCTNDDPEGRRRAIDLVSHPSGARLYPVGRLDQESSGLLLLTNDGELANRLTHPRYGVHKAYEVTVDGALDAEEVKTLERGVFLSDRHTTHGKRHGRKASAKMTLLRTGRDRTRILMELHEGRNRQIRRMLLYVGHKVRKLRRVRLGPLKLSHLQAGHWRDLTRAEVDALRKAAFATPEPAAKPKRGGSKKKTRENRSR